MPNVTRANVNAALLESAEIVAITGQPKPGGGMQVTHSHLVVKGKVAGLTQEQFAQAAIDAEKGCPISNALRNNIEITVQGTLV